MLPKIRKALFLLVKNPLLFCQKMKKRFLPFLPQPGSPVSKKINGVAFEFDFKLGYPLKHMFYSVCEPETVMSMKKFLSPGSIFIDVGANIGYFSMIALGLVGKKGEVHSFEPVPEFCRRIEKIKEMNPSVPLVICQAAAGETQSLQSMYVRGKTNIGWNTLIPSLIKAEQVQYQIETMVIRLDEYLNEKNLRPALFKIDVEGYEFPVLKGLSGYFEKSRPPIICEIAPAAYGPLGYSLENLAHYMDTWGYHAVSLEDRSPLNLAKIKEVDNILFLQR
jgi:FkbM family methyltransferase